MTIHAPCAPTFKDLLDAILTRAKMDISTFSVIEETGEDFQHVRKAVDPAMNEQNLTVQNLLAELLECECPIVKEEAKYGKRAEKA